MTTHEPRYTELASEIKAIEALEHAFGLTNPPRDISTQCSATGELYADAMSHQSRRLIMKTIIASCAIALLTTSALADTPAQPDLSDRNGGLTHRVMCSNVPARSGSVAGVLVPNIGYFVEEASAPYAIGNRIAGVIPAGLSSKDAEEITYYLQSIGLTNFILETRRDRKERIIEEEVVADRGVAFGDVPSGDNLTSMGNAVSDGATILRVRSTIPQDVSIRKAGGDAITVSVGAGDTYVPVDGSGTYIATFTGTNVTKTKATGPQDFNDISINEVVVRTSTDGKWCR